MPFSLGEPVLKVVERFSRLGGSDIPSAVNRFCAGHDRVVIVTGEQTRPGWLPSNDQLHGGGPERLIGELIPRHVPLCMWNFGGYSRGAAPSGQPGRHTLGGLTDAAFSMIAILEQTGSDARWPWESAQPVAGLRQQDGGLGTACLSPPLPAGLAG